MGDSEEIPYGYCHCRCGQKAPLMKHNRPGSGEIKGEPWRYIPGHFNNVRRQEALDKIPERSCVGCGFQLILRENENAYDFGKRKYCSQECYIRVLTEQRRTPGIAALCKNCGKTFTFKKGRERDYCSRVCFGKAHSRWVTDAHADTLIAHACEFCEKEFIARTWSRRKCCSNSCASNIRVRTRSLWRPTAIERAVQDALAVLGIAFVSQMRVGPWLVDFVATELQIAIEVNGTFWHCDPRKYPDGPISVIQSGVTDRDRRKRIAVEEAGYRLVVLWEKDINEVGAQAMLISLLGDKLAA